MEKLMFLLIFVVGICACASNETLIEQSPAVNLSNYHSSTTETLIEFESTLKLQKNLNFAAIDRIEAIPVNDTYLKLFIEEGRLSMGDN